MRPVFAEHPDAMLFRFPLECEAQAARTASRVEALGASLARDALAGNAAHCRLLAIVLFHAAGNRRHARAARARLSREARAYHDAAATAEALASEIPHERPLR